MKVTNDYTDFEIIDTSNGNKLERWGSIYLLRPDPLVMWDNGDLEKIYVGPNWTTANVTDSSNMFYNNRS